MAEAASRARRLTRESECMSLQKGHLPFLDGIRGVAILAVFLFHSLGVAFGFDRLPWKGLFRDFGCTRTFLPLYPLTYGWAGVALFFVVSGFCIHLSHQRSKDKGWMFFANRRFFRIYPPYFLAVCVFFFLWPWTEAGADGVSPAAQLLTHLLAINNLGEATFFGINPSLWSIAVEIQLYAIYPLLLALTGRLGWSRGVAVVAGIEIGLTLARTISGEIFGLKFPFFLGASPFAYWLSWTLGAYLCECFMTGRSSRMFTARFDVVAVAALLLPLFKPTAPFSFLAFAWLTAIAIERLMTGKWKLPEGGVFKVAWLHLGLLGVISYSFYLIHQPILMLTRTLWGKLGSGALPHPLVMFLTCLAWYPAILLAAYAMYRWVEKPSIALGKAAWNGMARRAVPAR